jgi:hypothetical protein
LIFDALDDTSIAYIVLNRWLPGLITVVAGGYMASILFPKLQRKTHRTSQFEEKKLEIAEKIVQDFNRYIISWRRLIQISELEEIKGLADDEAERKKHFVNERNQRRDSLLDSLKLCQLYFSESACIEMQSFVDWDEKQTQQPLDQLPSIEAWRNHEKTLVSLIRYEIS